MAIEYNSKLINDLYQTHDPYDAEKILEEMREIGDPVFIYPIYAAYKKFTYALNLHYFITTLNDIESKEVLNIMIEIISDPDVKPLVYTYALETFLKYEYFEANVVTKAGLILYQFSINKIIIDLENLLKYLNKSGAISGFTTELMTIFENDKFDTEDRILALSYLLNSDPKKWLQYFIDNYDKIANQSAEILLSKTLITWRGPLAEQLKRKITNDGGARAKEIIENSQKRQTKEQEELEKKEAASYSNSRLITGIIELREKINLIATTSQNIGFNIFPQRETFYKQSEAATNEVALKNCCIELRELIQDINDGVNTHGISFDEASKIIPELQRQDFNKSINKLHLFLHSKKINVDSDLYGLKTVNKLVNLWLHPNTKTELVALLQKLNMVEMYQKEDWVSIHRQILNLYLTFLKKFHEELTNYSKVSREEIAQEAES